MAVSILKLTSRHRALSGSRRWMEPIVFLVVLLLFFGYLSYKMGLANMMNTLMQTSYSLLLETVFFIMGITVLMGALSKLLAEFGVVDMFEKILRPLMKPLFNLPGVAALGAVVTFLSDNPAIIALSKNGKFAQNFKVYQLVSLTNFGTAWGMGLVVLMFMMAQGYATGALVGLLGAACGCIISTRLMQRFTLKAHPEYDVMVNEFDGLDIKAEPMKTLSNRPKVHTEVTTDENQSTFMRVLNSLLDGGKQGVELGMGIIPGVLIISTLVMMLTFNTTEFTGAAYQGVGLLPFLADKVSWLFEWLFGFQNSELLAFPMTTLGAVGAAIGLVPSFAAQGILDGNAVAVFTAMGMCWSGFLSTHAAMLDTMGFRQLISKAITAHAIAGFFAGVIAHWAFVGLSLLIG